MGFLVNDPGKRYVKSGGGGRRRRRRRPGGLRSGFRGDKKEEK